MTVPKASQFCCLSLKFVNQVWVWVHFFLLIFGISATISVGVAWVLRVNFTDFEVSRSDVFKKINGFIDFDEITAQDWLAAFLILSILIIICHYYLNGIEKNTPQNLLPFTFINAFAGVSLIIQNFTNINEFFCVGAIYCFAAICSYSLYDSMLVENMEKLEIRLQEASEQTKNTNKISLYPQVPPPYSKNNHIV